MQTLAATHRMSEALSHSLSGYRFFPMLRRKVYSCFISRLSATDLGASAQVKARALVRSRFSLRSLPLREPSFTAEPVEQIPDHQ